LSREYLPWLKQFLPYKHGIPQAQTCRKVFQLLKPDALEKCFAGWFSSLQDVVRGVIAIGGKTLRGSKTSANGGSVLHVVSLYACETGLALDSAPLTKKAMK